MKLIDKDALVAEIENLLDKGKYHDAYQCAYRDGNNGALYALKGKLDTLEVKEVDLEKEINNYISNNFFGSQTISFFANRTKEEPNDRDIALVAKHFFELGLKAKAKNIWHGANKEEPKIGKAFATIDSKGVMCAEYHVFEGGLTFKQMKEMDEIVKWAYTDDLIPKD